MSPTDPATDTALEVTLGEPQGGIRSLRVTVPAERVARIRARERRELGGSVNLDGFRPGKVPPPLLEERYGPVIRERTVQAAVEDAFRQVVRDEELRPVGRPEIRDVDYEEGAELSFRAEVEVQPTLDLARTGDFRVERPSVDVTEEDVEEILERLRGENAVWEPVDRSPGEGDQVSVRIWPEEETDEEEGSEKEPYRFELGEGAAIPDVEAAIRTLGPGESGVFDVDFPEDFDDGELAGASRRLHVELLSVKEKDLPPLDDAFAAEVGDFESLEGLRDAIRDDLRQHQEEEAEESVRRDLLDAIVEANPFEVPPAMVDRYLDRVMDVPEGADPEQVQEARRSLEPRAEQEIKRQLVMDHLVEEGGFEATDEELEARLEEMADRRDEDVEQVRRRLRQGGRLEGVRQHIAAEKLFEHLKTESTITGA